MFLKTAKDAPPKCRRCDAEMKRGQVLVNRATAGAPDFPGDSEGVTFSYGSVADLEPCWKCPECGYSIY